jgi:glycosyltransferase involved in cell wall biosynthesis
MTLAIISHTEHYKTADGTLVGWGPTVTEINNLLNVFDRIYHIAMIYDIEAPDSALPYVSDRVVFVPLPALGGRTLGSKLSTLMNAPKVLQIINKTLKKVDWFQFRAPTGIGVYVIPFLILCSKYQGWFKYAGNWNQEMPPLGYRFQRWLLKQQSRIVTINGYWDKQPKHCLTFENPCLTDTELIEGAILGQQKSIEGKLSCCFVGRLEKPKGVQRIIQAIDGLSLDDKNRISAVHFVGDGSNSDYFKSMTKKSGINFIFHGALSREQVFKIYAASQFFLMPTTASEGFPKAIAEAMNFGCIPIVSNISSIGQYITQMKTGICLEEVTSTNLNITIKKAWSLNDNIFLGILENQRPIVEKFSFSHYNHRISSEIIQHTKEIRFKH